MDNLDRAAARRGGNRPVAVLGHRRERAIMIRLYCPDCKQYFYGSASNVGRVHSCDNQLGSSSSTKSIMQEAGEPMSNNTDSNEQQDDSLLCEWCAKGDKADFLDSDGTRVSITGNDGILSHGYEDSWWPCLKFGVELHCSRASLAAPTEYHEGFDDAARVSRVLTAAASSPLPAEPPNTEGEQSNE